MKERGIDYDHIVNDYHLTQIAEDIKAIQHARNCGCFQCLKYAARLEWQVGIETARMIHPPDISHEEIRDIEKAIILFEQRQNERD
jgi:hypothetical protein